MQLRIAILGTRGIPNQYGGFEQVAGYLSAGLVKNGHQVTVYNPHDHSYKEHSWQGVQIVHCYDPAKILGTAGQFIYDLNCIRDTRIKKFDVILVMGYTSSSVWGWLYPKRSVIITNMDGMEWKRSKYSKAVRFFLKYAEKLAIQYSDFHIADSPVIKKYLDEKYAINSEYIPYGADIVSNNREEMANDLGITKGEYFLLMARMEPENNIETILDGLHQSSSNKKFVVIGNATNKFGKYLVDKFKTDERIIFAGSIFDEKKIQMLRAEACLYFHGHSVGGTNPSLLEAMAGGVLIVAHDNPFNRACSR